MSGDVHLELQEVSRIYTSGPVAVTALRELSLELERSSYTAVMGPSGSGKSTLLHILGCLDRPTAGRYRLDGQDVSTLPDRELAGLRNRAIGFVFQRFHLLEDETAVRNVELPLLYAGIRRRERRQRARDMLGQMGLEGRADHRPGQLSGGEQQRVALARALVKRPALLLADEPTGNLDSAAGARILDLVDEEHARGTTVVLITHEAEVARRASRRLHLRDGRLVTGREGSRPPSDAR